MTDDYPLHYTSIFTNNNFVRTPSVKDKISGVTVYDARLIATVKDIYLRGLNHLEIEKGLLHWQWRIFTKWHMGDDMNQVNAYTLSEEDRILTRRNSKGVVRFKALPLKIGLTLYIGKQQTKEPLPQLVVDAIIAGAKRRQVLYALDLVSN